jgi:hypothetical protein
MFENWTNPDSLEQLAIRYALQTIDRDISPSSKVCGLSIIFQFTNSWILRKPFLFILKTPETTNKELKVL